MTIPTYDQHNEAWGACPINHTESTIAGYGCTVSCLAMLFTGFGQAYTPNTMEQYLESLGAFSSDLVWWTKVPGFIRRFYCAATVAPIDEIKERLAAGYPVLLNVHLGLGGAYKPNHWVLAVDTEFTIHDPFFGDVVRLAARYGPPEKAILGGAYIELPKPIIVADVSAEKLIDHEFTVDLAPGSSNQTEVKALQLALAKVGLWDATIAATGRYGSITQKYVGKFQEKYHVVNGQGTSVVPGVYGYGFFGPATRKVMNAL